MISSFSFRILKNGMGGVIIHHVVMHTNYNWFTWSCHNYFSALQTGDPVWCISTCTTYYNNTDIHEWYSTIIHRADHAGQFFAIATWSIYNFFQNPCIIFKKIRYWQTDWNDGLFNNRWLSTSFKYYPSCHAVAIIIWWLY